MGGHASSHINRRSFLRGVKERWRQGVFATLCLVSVLGGLYWYQKSKPIQIPPDIFINHNTVNVYVSDPAAAVTLTVAVYPALSYNASIYISIRPPHPNEVVSWLVTVDVDKPKAQGATALPTYHNRTPGSWTSETVYKGSTSTQSNSSSLKVNTIMVGSYNSDWGYRFFSNGTFVAIPPFIETGSHPWEVYPGELAYVLESSADGRAPKSPHSQALVDTTDEPPGPIDKDVAGAITKEAFYVPTSLTAIAQLGVGNTFDDYQSLQAEPTAGLFDPIQNTLTWRADNSLDGIETAVSSSAEDARSNESFFAGIALAIAAAAGIAFLQERPRKQEAVEQPPSTEGSEGSSGLL
jgi:hypothetical protein